MIDDDDRYGICMRRGLWLRAVVVVVAIMTAGLAFTYAHLLISGQHTIRLADFLAYYTGGTLILQGHGQALYSFPAIAHAEARISYPLKMPGGVSPFIYPPWFALFMTPFSLLPYTVAYAVWFAGNVVFALFSLFALQRFAGLRGAPAVLVPLLGLSFLPVFAAFAQGQVSVLLLALTVFVVWALRGEHEILAGVALSLLMIKPQYALPVAGVLLLRRDWTACGVFALCSALLVVIPMPILGSGIEGAYVKGLIHLSRLHGNAGYMAPPPVNYSLQGFLALVAPSYATLTRLSLAGIALLVTGWSARRDRGVAVPVALAVLFGLLASPHVLVYDVSLLIFPVLVLISRNPAWTPVAVAAYLAPIAGLLLHLSVPLVVPMMGITMVGLAYSTWKGERRVSEARQGARPAVVATT